MNIFLLYATYSNSTALASEDLKMELEKFGYKVDLKQISEISPEEMQKAEFLLLASPSWDYNGEQGMPHEDFLTFKDANPTLQLANKPFAVMGLGDSSFTYYCGAVDHLTKWFSNFGGQPIIAPLKIDQYYVNETEAKQAIAEWAVMVDAAIKQLSA